MATGAKAIRPASRSGPRRRRVALLACALFVAVSGAQSAAPVQPRPVQDPHYGDGLFQFFQENYFASITTLMVSQHFARLPLHADEAELLRGGMLLSYGLHHEAGEIFTRLIDGTTMPVVRDRAWYYVGKIRYQRGFAFEAEEALGKVGSQLPPDLEDDRRLMQASLLAARDDHLGAAVVLGTIAGQGAAGRFARFNLGVALVKAGQPKEGMELLDWVGRSQTPPPVAAGASPDASTEEFQALRDKANLALGYAALRTKNPEDARTYLERVRLTGLQSNKALLAYGWAADELKNPKLALVPWTELAQRPDTDEAVLEARIAVPYAYSQLRAYGQALDRYNDAIGAFERESRGIDDTVAAIRSGTLLASLEGGAPGEPMGWFASIERLPDGPHAARLAPVLATHTFQEGFKNFRDLQFLAGNLAEWRDKLGVFDDMLANRRQAYAERLPKVLAEAGAANLGALQRRADALTTDLTIAEQADDAAAFADDRQREQLARLARVQSALKQADGDTALDTARERARLVAGALDWQLAQALPERLWNARKALAATHAALAEARRSEAALAQAQRDEPARFEAFAARIQALGPRIGALIPQVAALRAEQQRELQELAVAQLLQQKDRLAQYTAQARFAVAQLYDRASLTRAPDHATPP